SPALQQANLLRELAEMLDLYVGPAINAGMDALNPHGANPPPVPTLTAFYNTILNPSDAVYLANRNNFLAQYPVTQAAVTQLTQNFQQNILTACQNVLNDKPLIENFFSADYPFLQLRSLQEIESTGSDFHKGGKQVLKLRFSIFYYRGRFPWFTSLRLIYK